jgi:type VI protein secretion system component VasK
MPPGPPGESSEAGDLPPRVTHGQMAVAVARGTAVPLATAWWWLLRWRRAWWVSSEHGWLRVTDQRTHDDLEDIAARFRAADTWKPQTGRDVPPAGPGGRGEDKR